MKNVELFDKVVPQSTIPEEPASLPPSFLDLPTSTADEVFAQDVVETPVTASAAGGGDNAEEEDEDEKIFEQYRLKMAEGRCLSGSLQCVMTKILIGRVIHSYYHVPPNDSHFIHVAFM
jgi:hypothetical protein